METTEEWLELCICLAMDLETSLTDFSSHLGDSSYPDRKRLRGHARHLSDEASALLKKVVELKKIIEGIDEG